jgi:hypothetical protein
VKGEMNDKEDTRFGGIHKETQIDRRGGEGGGKN